jgi:DNA-directed RNA polymerase specialized sigma24 family protein
MGRNGHSRTGWSKRVQREIERVYEPVVQWICNRLGIGVEESREAVHTVIARLDGKASRIKKWDRYLTRAAVREYRRSQAKPRMVLFSELSREDRKRLYSLQAPGPDPAEEAAKDELVELFRERIGDLPARQGEVMTLDLVGETGEEIRSKLGLESVATVRSNRRKGRAVLRKNIFEIE